MVYGFLPNEQTQCSDPAETVCEHTLLFHQAVDFAMGESCEVNGDSCDAVVSSTAGSTAKENILSASSMLNHWTWNHNFKGLLWVG